ncbi:EamA family transporter [Peribacillus huizhouensis]|uniref:Drug/metabolite transporter (DMT)-like permease n=1 Tax=Peribacillus huizhouensis TaxID=1501239 RepID=A0ABR6CV07_9BACI|nr:DMT family transporter [Peribacillus huizhouensis]MBA9028167.1 drug/metabolite transporter (DMT)-like permease [Peribacillus huizhouensis]
MGIWKYAFLVFLGGCSYGVISSFVKLGYREGFGIGELSGSQYLLGAIMLWIITIFVPKIKLSVKQKLILLISGMPMGVTGVLYNKSLGYVDASFAIILLLQFTWISIILQYVFDKKIPNRKSIIATAIILCGSVLASGFLSSELSFSVVGIGWGLLSALSFATFIYVSGRASLPIHPIYKSAIMTTGAALLVFIVLPPVFLLNGAFADGLLKYGLLIGFFGSLVPPLLFNIAMPKVGSGLGTILSASELPTAVLMSTLVLHEVVTFSQWSGVAVILFGIAYPNFQGRKVSSYS